MGQGSCCHSKESCALEDALSMDGCSLFRDELCDQQHCINPFNNGSWGGARGRLSSDIGKLEAECNLQDLQKAKISFRANARPVVGSGSGRPRRVSQFFEPCEGDRVCYVHCSEVLWPVGGVKASKMSNDFTTECEAQGTARCGHLHGLVEFMAASNFKDVTATVRCGGEELGKVRPVHGFKLNRFECHDMRTTSQSIELSVGDDKDSSMIVSLGFGLRIRSLDVLTSLRVEAVEAEGSPQVDVEDVEAWKKSLTMQAAHHGKLYALPRGFCYRAETSVEFLAYGLCGSEEMDCYINGLTVLCASNVQLGSGPNRRSLYRFVVAPISCEIRSVVLRVRLNEPPRTARPHHVNSRVVETAGVVIDKEYGLRILGQDALPGTHFVDSQSYIMNPYDWNADSVEQRQLSSGQWSWDGYYYLLAYKRSKKLHLPMSGVDSVDSVAKVVEPELVAAPLLLGASSRSRDVGIKDDVQDICFAL